MRGPLTTTGQPPLTAAVVLSRDLLEHLERLGVEDGDVRLGSNRVHLAIVSQR